MMDSEEITTPDVATSAAPIAALAGLTLQTSTPSVAPEAENEEDEEGNEDEGSEWNDEDDDEDDSEDDYDEEDEAETCDHEPRPKHKKPKPMASLVQLAERGILKQLTKAIDGQRVTARYCCGGRVRALPPGSLPFQNENEKPRKVPRLTMRWDDAEDRRGRKVHFPHTNSPPRKLDAQIETLAERCQATGLLDGSKFSIDFDPHFYGIIDIITQVLLPGLESEVLKGVPEQRGVRAKLSNLQVRSPGGKTDIPLNSHGSTQYFGKLLVCLPCAHQGGQWEISSDGHSTIFDWSNSEDVTTAQWAAFVGDCTHECQPVEEGHQFVLAYNLFINQRVGEALRDTSTADPTLFPLYAGVKEMLDHPGFMKKGGVLGFYCQYPYPHVHPNAAKQLPPSLQGVDMVFYSVFKSLGLKIDILPLLDSSPLDEMDEMEYEREEECYIDDPWSYREFYCDSDEENDIWECEYCRPEFPSFEEWKAKKPRVDRIGTKLHGLKFTEDGSDEAMYIRSQKEENLMEFWSWKEYEGIRWLNEPEKLPKGKGWEIAIVNDCFDPDGGTEKFYSHPVILITVPKLVDRNLTVAE